MADEMAPGEVGRNVARIDAALKEIRDSMTALAAQMVPTTLWDAQHRSIEGRLTEHLAQARSDFERLERMIADVRSEAERISSERHKTAMRTVDKARTDAADAVKGLREELTADEQRRQRFLDTTWGRITAVVMFLVALTTVILTAMSLKG